MTNRLRDGADERARIDAVMVVETTVLERQQHFQIVRIDVLRIERQAPAAFGRRECAQQAIFAIDDGHGLRLRLIERQGSDIGERFSIDAVAGSGRDKRQRRACDEDFTPRNAREGGANAARCPYALVAAVHRRPAHLALTVSLPPAVRA